MSKKGPDAAPPPPDPYAVSNAQTGSNVNTAVANSVIGNANTYDPYGSTTFKQIGSTDVGGNAIPQWQKTTTLAPAQQQMLDLQNQAGINLDQIAVNQSSAVGNLLSHPVSTEGLQPWQTAGAGPSFNGLPGGPSYQVAHLQGQDTSHNPQLQTTMPVGQQATSFQGGGPIAHGYNYSQAPTGFAGGGPIQNGFGDVGGAQRSFGPTGNVQDSVNLGGYQSGFDAPGNIQGGVNQNYQPTDFGAAGQITNSVGPQDFSADRDAVTNALLSRINPQLDRDRSALNTQAINQGFVPGTAAYDTAMDSFNRQANDQRTQAVLAGGQEQSRLAGLQLNQANFANSAQNQGYNQQQGRGLFGLQAAGQNNAEALNAGQFANTAQQQGFGQNQARAQFGQQATQLGNEAALNAGNFANSAQQQQYGQALGAGNFANAGQAQDFGQTAQRAQFANEAQGQRFGQNQSQGLFGLQATNQNNQNNAAAAAFGNTAQAQGFGQNQAQGQFGNQAVGANNAANLAGGQFQNQAAGQAYAQQQGQLAFNNAVAQGNAAGANDAANQAYQNAVAQTQYGNTNAQQGYQNAMAGTQLNNQIRGQQMQEQYGQQSFPINQITALMSGGQVQQPAAVGYQGGQIAPTNVGGNVYNSAALQQQNYQSQLAQQNAAMGGMFGLGSAALMGGLSKGSGSSLIGGLMGLSDRRLKRDIIDTGISLMNGLKLYSFRYLWSAVQHIGVMAQDVMVVKPEAVIDVGGVYVVNYALAMEAA